MRRSALHRRGYLVDALYQDANVQQRLEETLPPPLNRLVAPAAAGLKQVVVREAPRLLGTAAALSAWEKAHREAHDALLAVVREFRGERLVDGGLLESIPYHSALREGATHVLVLRSRDAGRSPSRENDGSSNTSTRR